jgi:hypothetical protein
VSVATVCRRSANAVTGWMAGKTTGTRVARGNQQDIRRETGAFIAAFDAHFAFFEWLTQAFKSGALKFGKLVEKQHSTVCPREFAGAKWTATAEQCLGRNAVVGRTKRSALWKRVHRAMK